MKLRRIVTVLLMLVILVGIMPAAYAAVAPKSIAINVSKIEVIGGSPKTVKATVLPANADQTVKWSSSNTKVATVSSKGVVTAKGAGTATITGKTVNGLKVSYTVTVPKTKTYTKTYTVIESNKPVLYYAKDKLTVIVDGVTGKIVAADVYQSKRDTKVVGQIGKEGAKVLLKTDDYVDFRTYWTINVGLFKGLSIKLTETECNYRMDKYGKLTLLSKKTQWF